MEEKTGRQRGPTLTMETARMLRNVMDYCYTIEVRSQWAKTDIEAIVTRPDFKVAADDALLDAISHITRAKIALEQAHKQLQEKPVEKA